MHKDVECHEVQCCIVVAQPIVPLQFGYMISAVKESFKRASDKKEHAMAHTGIFDPYRCYDVAGTCGACSEHARSVHGD